MSQYRFLDVFRTARSAAAGRWFGAAFEPGLPVSTEEAARTADLWLTPELTEDYDRNDFRALPAGELATLDAAVGEFRQLAGGLAGGPPPAADVERGWELFRTINGVIGPRYLDEPDVRRIADAVRSIALPDFVLWVDCRLDNDWSGDPAARIVFVLTDDADVESPAFQDEMIRVRLAYIETVQRAGIDRWPYMSVRLRSDMKPAVGAPA